jgi:4-amino-4-deoxy-L-arabinose transferase-like glycosyltransferase
MANSRRRKRKKLARGDALALTQRHDETALARRALRIIVICGLVLAVLYVIGIPFGKGPDETAHLRYVEWLAQNQRLPVFDRQFPGADYEFHQPPLYYLVCLPTYLLTAGSGETGGQAVRLTSVLISLVLLYLTFALGRALAPERPLAAATAAAVVAFLPMHLSLASSIGNDVLTEIFFAAALLTIVHYLRAAHLHRTQAAEHPPSPWAMVSVGLFTGLGLLTKSLAVLLFPAAWVTAALAARGPESYDFRRFLRDLAVATGVALLIAGWWLARNQVLYGDPLAQKAFLGAFQDRPSPADILSLGRVGLAGYVGIVFAWTSASATGVFGPVYANRFAFFPSWVYITTGVVAITGILGFFLRYLQSAKLSAWQRQAWWLCGLLAVLLLASFVRFNLSFFQAQARYLFPALPPAALAFALGLEQLSPGRARPWVLLAAAVLLAALSIVGLPLWILPQFRIS